jgi:hypothetical protein
VRAIRVILVLLAIAGVGPAKAQDQVGDDLSKVIEDYLGGSSDIGGVISGAIGAGGAPCSLPDGSSTLGIRRLYDTLMLVGEVLCKVGVTCFTQYARDLFPLPVSPGDLNIVFASSSDVLLVGRWYQVYAPLMRLGEAYAALLASQGGGQVEPFAIVLYPDIKAGEDRLQVLNELLKINLLPVMGDRDVIEKLAEVLAEKVEEKVRSGGRGDLVFNGDALWRLLLSDKPAEEGSSMAQAVRAALKPIAIPWPRSDRGDDRSDKGGDAKQKAKEVFFRTLQDAFPGFIVAIGKPESGQPIRTILIVGSSVPDSSNLFRLDALCSSGGQDQNAQQWNRQGESYFELVGRVPYAWNTLMGIVLPVAKTVIQFAEQMERKEKPFSRDNGQGGATAP